MEAIAHNKSFAKKVGVPQSVGKDYAAADKGKKFAAGGMARIGKQDTRHGKVDMPFNKLNRFAGMNAGGTVKKYAKGGFAEEFINARNRAILEGNDPDKEIFTFRGKKYISEIAKGGAKPEFPRGFLERARKSEDQATSEANRIAGEVDRLASNYPNPCGRDVSQEEMSQYSYRKGGSVKESKAMVKKEVSFMKKKGAPTSMIKHEAAEMGAMKKGGMMRAKKDIAADQMAMAPYKKGGAMARGGGIESKGKTKGTMMKMAGGGYVRAADGCATKGKTKGKMV
jgi:hypothetical protein